MTDYAIRVKNITKIYKLYNKPSDRLREALGSKKVHYEEHYALNDVSFDVKRGETVGIIGTNGSGKSTVLKIITGVLSQTSGTVEIDGRISALLELGAGMNMEYTGMENIYLNGTMIGFSRQEIDAKVDAILKFADIGEFINQPVKTYSSGMFVRLAFAIAINIDPEILIVDEALSVGDVFFQAKCFKKFEDFKKEGKTILMVSHDLGSIAKYCDRVILLNQGVKLNEGKPKEMVDLYKKLMVNQYDVSALGKNSGDAGDKAATVQPEHLIENEQGEWKNHYSINPNLNEYGSGKAEIIDFAVVDDKGNYTNTLEKGADFTIRSKVRFNEEIENPIFTYTIKNVQGVAITGTNTMFEKTDTGTAKPGDVYVCSFRQNMNLQGGEYLLSISCTGFADGSFTVYHRLYDVISLTVVSDKNTVGFYDMNSKVTVQHTRNGEA